jgi:hypothetical protein
MQISSIVRQELDKRGFANLKSAAQYLGVSTELLRMFLNKGRLPKDRLLIRIADRLGLDRASMVLAAHKQKLPRDLQGFFLEPQKPVAGVWGNKRKWPLSQEQCEYLARIMNEHEIQLVRKYRQLTEEQRAQALGYLDYHFQIARRKAKVSSHAEDREPEMAGVGG